MSDEQRRDSLADQAAAWVPPWDRPRPPAADTPTPPDDSAAPPDTEEPAEPTTDRAALAEALPEAAARRPEPDAADSAEPDVVASGSAQVDPDGPVPGDAGLGGPGPVEVAAGGPGPVEVGPGGPDPLEVASDEAGPGEPDRVEAAPDEVGSAGPDLGAVTQATAGESGGAEDVPRRQLAGRRRATVAPEPAPELSDPELRGALEAILLVVDEPVSELVLAQVLEQPAERVGPMLDEIAAGYTAAGHGFELRRAAGGWRLYTRPEYATYVERFVLDGQSVRLTQAALETLAVVAYKQPVTRSRISAIRGVNCDGVIRTLVTRGLIEECGTETDSGAFLYRTTTLFLEKLGLNTVDELPPLAPFLPDDVEELADATR
ncbi:SMC-Scp complex subunit ScpB [Micromonospora saelicesensis]|uniref:Segregation and condensation protein B n=1 Tax=Micromonospora saelicesensis TaxID=285676 RepID=A0A1C5A006_9ACTN|nr:SMC-Scp complex subunit ScpB [Micromonospora saelicesensis]SCF38431.1 segregation and condensation protein B [Micromonospora saelicesensis]